MTDPIPRTASSQAMQSLFSAYDEDEVMDDAPAAAAAAAADDQISGSDDESMPPPPKSPPITAILKDPTPRPSPQPKKMTKLVSYQADEAGDEDDPTDEDDEGDEAEIVNNEPPQPYSLVDYNISINPGDPDASVLGDQSASTGVLLAGGTATPTPGEDDIMLPPEPAGKCPKDLQQKITRYYEKMLRTGKDLSRSIEHRKDFRNPSIYEKLIQFVDIDEKGTNYPPHLYDPSIWGADSFYDNLAKLQKEEMDKREKARTEKTKVEFVTATKKNDANELLLEAAKRKSKWDAQPTGGASGKPLVVTAAGVATNPSLVSVTTAPSGTKATVIPATGSLKKMGSAK